MCNEVLECLFKFNEMMVVVFIYDLCMLLLVILLCVDKLVLEFFVGNDGV